MTLINKKNINIGANFLLFAFWTTFSLYIADNFFGKKIGFFDSFVNLPNFFFGKNFNPGYHNFKNIFFATSFFLLITFSLSFIKFASAKNIIKFIKDKNEKDTIESGKCNNKKNNFMIYGGLSLVALPFIIKLIIFLFFCMLFCAIALPAIMSINFIQDIFNSNIITYFNIALYTCFSIINSISTLNSVFEFEIAESAQKSIDNGEMTISPDNQMC